MGRNNRTRNRTSQQPNPLNSQKSHKILVAATATVYHNFALTVPKHAERMQCLCHVSNKCDEMKKNIDIVYAVCNAYIALLLQSCLWIIA